MYKLLVLSFLFLNAASAEEKVWITLDSDALSSTMSLDKSFNSKVYSSAGISLIQVNRSEVENISHMMHDQFKRCGGYMIHESLEEGLELIDQAQGLKSFVGKSIFTDYQINQKDLVNRVIEQVTEKSITEVILKLSSFKNRYYKSKHGVASSTWIKDHWQELAKNRNDISVDLYKHKKWAQPSVIMTIKGNSPEVIVIGGHADSISGFWNRNEAKAPGADDNASGIATITETLRVLIQNNYRPEKTLKFMAYAAEEVGLLGSKEIATEFKNNNVDVVGVLQLDMTNYNGSDLNIVMMTDYTNSAQNEFLGTLIDEYVKLSWGYDKCGYGCSDHASWYAKGYPASIPFEARKNNMNRNIHTAKDLLSVSGDHSNHAVKFAKLALAYVIELDQ